MTLLVVGTALGVWCLLLAQSLPSIVSSREARAAARVPSGLGGAAGEISQIEHRLGARTITIVKLAPRLNIRPPGVEKFPSPGESVASPSLIEALRRDKRMDRVFPYKVHSVISQEGLVSPDELFAYVIAETDAVDGEPYANFGVQHGPPVDLRAGDLAFVQRSLLGLVGIPLFAYFAVAARLSAAARSRRLAALRLLGMTSRETQRVNGIESLVSSTAGVILGAAFFFASAPLLARTGIAGMRWFSADASPDPANLVPLFVFIPAMAWLLSWVGARRAIGNALAVRRNSATPKPRLYRLIPLAAGGTILIGFVPVVLSLGPGEAFGSSAIFSLLGAVVLTTLGLAFGLSPLTWILADNLALRARRLPLLLGARRLQFDTTSPVRVVTGLVIIVFLVGFASGLQRDALAATQSVADFERYTINSREVDATDRSRLMKVQGVTASAVMLTSEQDPPAEGPSQERLPYLAMVATCRSVQAFAQEDLPCREGEAYRILSTSSRGRHRAQRLSRSIVFPLSELDSGESIDLPVPVKTISTERPSVVGLQVDFIFPPSVLGETDVPERSQVWLGSSKDPATIDNVATSLAQIAPNATVQYPEDNFKERRQIRTLIGLFRAGLVLGVAIGFAAFVVASIDRAIERRSNLTALAIVGVSRATSRLSQVVQTILPLSIGAIFSVVLGSVTDNVLAFGGGFVRQVAWGDALKSLLVALIAGILVAGSTALAIPRRTDISLIRHE